MSKSFLNRLFCKHEWETVFDEATESTNYSKLPLVYPLTVLKCAKCGERGLSAAKKEARDG